MPLQQFQPPKAIQFYSYRTLVTFALVNTTEFSIKTDDPIPKTVLATLHQVSYTHTLIHSSIFSLPFIPSHTPIHLYPFIPSHPLLPPYLLSKVLTVDVDKAVLPYKSLTQSPPDIKVHEKACNRLFNYRQPLGIGLVKMNYFDFSQLTSVDVVFPFFVQRQCASDKDIAQMIKVR